MINADQLLPAPTEDITVKSLVLQQGIIRTDRENSVAIQFI